ncbi:ferritin-like domain-containing protein [[Eubacterium] cellulosolvens]
MAKERLIEALNDLVAVEIAAVTEYQQHAYLINDPKMIEVLEDFSMDEMAHIEYCSREVARLGGIPTVLPKEIKQAGKTPEELLQRDVHVEADAIKRLTEYMKIAEEEGEPKIKKLLEDIRADEIVHHDMLEAQLTPTKNFWGKMKNSMDIGSGLILTGLFWLYFWIFQWYVFFLFDARWAHNFAYPLILITIGVAYKGKKMSTDLLASISAFMIIPTETGLISGTHSTYIVGIILLIILLLLLTEKGRKRELLFLQHRSRRWLKKHLLTFAFLFLLHMPFLYWATRVLFGEPAEINMPPEPPWERAHWGTASYNILVIPFALLGMAERFRGTLRRRISMSKLGYWLSVLIIILGIIVIGAASGDWLRYSVPLLIAVIILVVSIIAYRK